MNGSSGDFTKIPNELLDNMDKMNESELRIALAIARKTLGWQKPEDRLSYSQFEAMTGLSRTAVRDGINAAILHRVIRRETVGAQTYRYSLPVGLSYQFDSATSSIDVPDPVATDYQYDDPTSSDSLPEPVGLSYQLAQKPVGLSYTQKNGSKEKEERPPIVAGARPNGDGGGVGVADRLAGFTFTDRQIEDALQACGDRLTDALLDQWQVVIDYPPKGLTNPTGAMVKRLTAGNTGVPLNGRPKDRANGKQPASLSPEQQQTYAQEKAVLMERLTPPRIKL